MSDGAHKNGWLYFQVLTATAVWGASYSFTRQLVSEVSPLTVVVLRAAVGCALLLPLSRAKFSRSDLAAGPAWRLLVLAALGVYGQQYIQALALKYTLASSAGWLISTIPIFVAALAAALGERIGPARLAAFALGAAGTLLVVLSKGGGFGVPATKGDLIFLVSCVDWAFYVLAAKHWLTSWGQAKVTAATMLAALLCALPFWLAAGGPAELAAITPRGWACVAYLGVLSSAVGYLFWNNAVEGLGPVRSSYFIYLQPFSAMLSAYLWLGEKPAGQAFLGGLLILGGVYLVGKRGRAPAALRGAPGNA